MLKYTLTISIIFLMLAIICFVCANVNFRKALKYMEQEQEEKSIKKGLLYLLFSKYSDLFTKITVICFIVTILIEIF